MAAPTNAELIAAIRELLEAFAAPAVDGADEERCLLAIMRQRELLEQVDAAKGPASDELRARLN